MVRPRNFLFALLAPALVVAVLYWFTQYTLSAYADVLQPGDHFRWSLLWRSGRLFLPEMWLHSHHMWWTYVLIAAAVSYVLGVVVNAFTGE